MSIKNKLLTKADKSFVDDWKDAWKWLSVQFSLFAGAIVAWATTDPDSFAKVIEVFPQELRIPVGIIISTVLPVYLRLKQQGGNSNG